MAFYIYDFPFPTGPPSLTITGPVTSYSPTPEPVGEYSVGQQALGAVPLASNQYSVTGVVGYVGASELTTKQVNKPLRFTLPSWSPSNLANSVAWWRADQGVVLSGTSVAGWNDQLNGIQANGTGSGFPNLLPTYSATGFQGAYPGILLSGNSQISTTELPNASIGLVSTQRQSAWMLFTEGNDTIAGNPVMGFYAAGTSNGIEIQAGSQPTDYIGTLVGSTQLAYVNNMISNTMLAVWTFDTTNAYAYNCSNGIVLTQTNPYGGLIGNTSSFGSTTYWFGGGGGGNSAVCTIAAAGWCSGVTLANTDIEKLIWWCNTNFGTNYPTSYGGIFSFIQKQVEPVRTFWTLLSGTLGPGGIFAVQKLINKAIKFPILTELLYTAVKSGGATTYYANLMFTAITTLLDYKQVNKSTLFEPTVAVPPGHSVAYVQGNTFHSDSANSYSVVLNTVGANSTVCGLWYFANPPTTDTIVSITDDKGNNYNYLSLFTDANSTYSATAFYLTNITNSPTTITAVMSDASGQSGSILAHEYSGPLTFDVSVVNNQSNSTGKDVVPGFDVVTSGNATTSGLDLLWAGTIGTFGSMTIHAGRGYTMRQNPTEAITVATEDTAGLTLPGTYAATFSPIGATKSNFTTFLLGFKTPSQGVIKQVNTNKLSTILTTSLKKVQGGLNRLFEPLVSLLSQKQANINRLFEPNLTVTDTKQITKTVGTFTSLVSFLPFKQVNKAIGTFAVKLTELFQKQAGINRVFQPLISLLVPRQINAGRLFQPLTAFLPFKQINKTVGTFTALVTEQIQKQVNATRLAAILVNFSTVYGKAYVRTYTFIVTATENIQKQVNAYRQFNVLVTELIQKQVSKLETTKVLLTELLQKQVGISRLFEPLVLFARGVTQINLYRLFVPSVSFSPAKQLTKTIGTFAVLVKEQIQKQVNKSFVDTILATVAYTRQLSVSRTFVVLASFNPFKQVNKIVGTFTTLVTFSFSTLKVKLFATTFAVVTTFKRGVTQVGTIRSFFPTVVETTQKQVSKAVGLFEPLVSFLPFKQVNKTTIFKVLETFTNTYGKLYVRTYTFVVTMTEAIQKQVGVNRLLTPLVTLKDFKLVNVYRLFEPLTSFSIQKQVNVGRLFKMLATFTILKQISKSFLDVATASFKIAKQVNVNRLIEPLMSVNLVKQIGKLATFTIDVGFQTVKQISKTIIEKMAATITFIATGGVNVYHVTATFTVAVTSSLTKLIEKNITAFINATQFFKYGHVFLVAVTFAVQAIQSVISQVTIWPYGWVQIFKNARFSKRAIPETIGTPANTVSETANQHAAPTTIGTPANTVTDQFSKHTSISTVATPTPGISTSFDKE